MLALVGGRKRNRGDDEGDDLRDESGLSDKKARPTVESADSDWFHDSVLGTPTASSQAREQPKYDSEDERSSSIVSEPGSPQDVSMSSGDEMDDGFPNSPEHQTLMRPRAYNTVDPWQPRLRTDRVPTPVVAMRPGAGPSHLRTGIKQHIRQRHPQENSSDHLELPSPIDEDEVPTPPSAAEAAGSQLSMLSVSDVDMEESDSIPTISIERVRPSNTMIDTNNQLDSAISVNSVDSTDSNHIFVRKQRQRSGALSGGNSPVRAGPSTNMNVNNNNSRRGFSMGFRADCEKCRMRVPGHMNHFLN